MPILIIVPTQITRNFLSCHLRPNPFRRCSATSSVAVVSGSDAASGGNPPRRRPRVWRRTEPREAAGTKPPGRSTNNCLGQLSGTANTSKCCMIVRRDANKSSQVCWFPVAVNKKMSNFPFQKPEIASKTPLTELSVLRTRRLSHSGRSERFSLKNSLPQSLGVFQERERQHQEWLKQARAYEQQEALQIRAEERRRIRHLGELVAKNRQTVSSHIVFCLNGLKTSTLFQALELIEQAVVNIRPQMQQHMRRREAGILRNCRGRQNGRTKSTSSRSNCRSLGRQNGRTKSTSSRSNRRSLGRQNGRTKSASSHSNMF